MLSREGWVRRVRWEFADHDDGAGGVVDAISGGGAEKGLCERACAAVADDEQFGCLGVVEEHLGRVPAGGTQADARQFVFGYCCSDDVVKPVLGREVELCGGGHRPVVELGHGPGHHGGDSGLGSPRLVERPMQRLQRSG